MALNPSISILIFTILTTIYSIVEYAVSKNNIIYFIIYLLLVLVSQFFINVSLTNSMCGFNQWQLAAFVTFIPWVVLFGLLNIVLLMFPGWLRPFSNTFGYMIAYLSGLNSTINDIFNFSKGQLDKSITKEMRESLAHIYNDKSSLINEVNSSNFDFFWNNMKGLIKPEAFTNINLKEKLLGYINLKDIVAKYIWFILTGFLITSISYNYIINYGCVKSAKMMQKAHDAHIEKIKSESKNPKPHETKVYTSTD